MKKVLSIVLSLALLLSASGCSLLEPDTVTIPALLLSEVDTEELETQLSGYCQSYTEQEDGSVTLVIGKLQHGLVLSQLSETIRDTLDGSYPSDDAPEIASVTCSDDFTEATVTLCSEDVSLSGLSATVAAVTVYYACCLYQFAAGIEEGEVAVTLRYVDAESNLLRETTSSYAELTATSTITIPAVFAAAVDLEEVESQLASYCLSFEEGEDGSLIIVVNQLQRSLLLAYLADTIQTLLDGAFPNDYITGLEAVTFSDDFTQVTLAVSSFDSALSAVYSYVASFVAYYIAGFYQIAAGADEDSVVLTVSIEDSGTGTLYQTFTLPLAD
ncbi:MAG: hypothetical protein LUC39_08875 [Clostridiales bacterium]|nr:hypothetical protein [Clostridiales bacterium]